MSKFIEVQIAKSKVSSLFLEVPDDFQDRLLYINSDYKKQLLKFADNLDICDWEDVDDEIEIDKIEKVTEEEAKKYNVDKLVVEEEEEEEEDVDVNSP